MEVNGLHSSEIEQNNCFSVGEGLRIHNSLTGNKDLFVTRDGSKLVTWYICGPTVYDSSHLGHARTYVTFDIIRRILERYFDYGVIYVMNVTDVDDKIINKARRNYLLEKYVSQTYEVQKVISDLRDAFQEEKSSQDQKVQGSLKAYEEAPSSRRKDELLKKIKEEQSKHQKICDLEVLYKGREAQACSLTNKAGGELLLSDGISDVLASYLDRKEGASVTDLAIYRAHAAKYEEEFWEDMQSLDVEPPMFLTRVTEYMDVIKDYVQRIVDRGFAYEANGSIYFDTKAFQEAGHKYGKLNPSAVGSQELASESESNFDSGEKKNSCDFALWKASKDGEPFWESPWGKGRPGWHIECSAMASNVIGNYMDIHSGGVDLQFPHHDNELAQAEAYYGCFQGWLEIESSNHEIILQVGKCLRDNFDTPGLSSTYGSETTLGSESVEALVTPFIDAASSLRDEVRTAAREGPTKEKLMQICDKFRDYTMVDLGVRVEDAASSSAWGLCPAETLRIERDEKLQKAKEATIQSLLSKIDNKTRDIEKLQQPEVTAKEFFANLTAKYNGYDERGFPTQDADGKPLSKKAQKDAEKLFEKKKKEQEKYEKMLAADPSLVEKLQSEVQALRKQLESFEN
ncbi:hypothetical protein AMTR_s00013p00135450 [Amborella trichopoda]|uniref:tRNA synthetases class I catalytic domain-containing protein n=1 Tax=Amborella trichopoda TaxID=13333 RepID=W1PPA1_AMBTC|nr:hypothetical protein AMTR_s00013p00135450 [Amborella trichopoda]